MDLALWPSLAQKHACSKIHTRLCKSGKIFCFFTSFFFTFYFFLLAGGILRTVHVRLFCALVASIFFWLSGDSLCCSGQFDHRMSWSVMICQMIWFPKESYGLCCCYCEWKNSSCAVFLTVSGSTAAKGVTLGLSICLTEYVLEMLISQHQREDSVADNRSTGVKKTCSVVCNCFVFTKSNDKIGRLWKKFKFHFSTTTVNNNRVDWQ